MCDRDELRSQGLGAFQNVFGADAASVSSGNPQKNARILIATYQTLDVADVLGELGYGLAPRTRPDRADAFNYKHSRWLSDLPTRAAATLKALAGQFARAGTESLENPQVFDMPDVVRAGGLPGSFECALTKNPVLLSKRGHSENRICPC